jgi:hypothetical protein
MKFKEYVNTFEAPWSKIVKKYAQLNQRYLISTEDAIFWYSELSNTGLLAAASWLSGYPCISEINEQKLVYTEVRGRPRRSPGFVDLFLYNDQNQGEWVEAKRAIRIVDASEALRDDMRISGLQPAMREALRSSRRSTRVASDCEGRAVSMVYVPFVLSDEYYGAGRRIRRRDERARAMNEKLHYFANSTNGNVRFASYFCVDHLRSMDENGYRPFGFSIVASIVDYSV